MIADGIVSGIAPVELYSFLAIVLAGLGAWKLVLGIQVSRKQLREIPSSGAQPQPFLTKRAEDVEAEGSQHGGDFVIVRADVPGDEVAELGRGFSWIECGRAQRFFPRGCSH